MHELNGCMGYDSVLDKVGALGKKVSLFTILYRWQIKFSFIITPSGLQGII